MMNLEEKSYGPYPKGTKFENFRAFADHIEGARSDCEERGYHLVENDDRDPLVCYHCDLLFGKEDCETMGINYNVEPL